MQNQHNVPPELWMATAFPAGRSEVPEVAHVCVLAYRWTRAGLPTHNAIYICRPARARDTPLTVALRENRPSGGASISGAGSPPRTGSPLGRSGPDGLRDDIDLPFQIAFQACSSIRPRPHNKPHLMHRDSTAPDSSTVPFRCRSFILGYYREDARMSSEEKQPIIGSSADEPKAEPLYNENKLSNSRAVVSASRPPPFALFAFLLDAPPSPSSLPPPSSLPLLHSVLSLPASLEWSC